MQGHPARKRFGQNFLADPHYVARIVDAIAPVPGDNLIEIGPGLAALTAPLIARAGRLTAIEIDRDLAARLARRFTPAELVLHVADALEFDYASLGERQRIVGNLPYNISSPLLFLLARFDQRIVDIHVMLQKEVVARMTASPATPDYGRLGVMLQARFAMRRLFVVPPGAFAPAPKVDSAVVRLTPLGDARPPIDHPERFARIVAAAFGQRRKTLRNALRSICTADTLERLGFDPGARGETLGVADFARLANLAPDLAGNAADASTGGVRATTRTADPTR